MKTPTAFLELTKMEVIDFLILRSVVVWSRQFHAFGETLYSVAVDIMGCEFDDYEEVAIFIRGRIAHSLGLYMTIPDGVCTPTIFGTEKYKDICALLDLAGVTDVDATYKGFIAETFKPYKPVMETIQ